ncbi:zinc-dependent metalloprotease [Reichenbachiella sp. MSK19-1]|uniref:zinc-dependent metalloprotease n=1 Tax=Reichenbachiella sp. MSK19-1 TaxID=1897631 RepID=UPI000E6CCD1F|nr:zinc-dependent metalloprotease [Reichenbachiella sp. MSK19-1]
MKQIRQTLLSILMCFAIYTSHAQKSTSHVQYCGQDLLNNWMEIENSDFSQQLKKQNEDIELRMNESARMAMTTSAVNGIYHIPVVFHFIVSQATLSQLPNGPGWTDEYRMYKAFYDGGASASSNRLLDQLARINTEFSDANISFCSAQLAPQTFPWQQITDPSTGTVFETAGATYTVDNTLAHMNGMISAQAIQLEQALPFNQANEPQYLNVYVTETTALGNQTVGGYALPGGIDGNGIYVSQFLFGDNTGNNPNYFLPASVSPQYEQGKTAVHEVGHWLSLWHTFATDGACTNLTLPPHLMPHGDFVADTPPQNNPSLQCSTTNMISCTSTLVPGNNHMDYTTDNCKVPNGSVMPFTLGQIQRMHLYLDNFLENIHSHTNRLLTGIEKNGCVNSPIPFTAEFEIDSNILCEAQSIQVEGLDIALLPAGHSLQWRLTLTDGTTTHHVPSASTYNTGAINTSFPTLGMGQGTFTMSSEMIITDPSSATTTISYQLNDPILIEDCTASAQKYTRSYEYPEGDLDNMSIVTTHAGDGYIVSGSNRNLTTDISSTIVLRADLFGNILWERTFDNNGQNIRGLDIIRNNSTTDTYIIAGSVESTAGNDDILVMEIDESGNPTSVAGNPFSINISSGPTQNSSAAFEIINTVDGGFALAGYVGAGLEFADAKEQLIVKLNQNFSVAWSERYDYSNNSTSDLDVANSILEIPNYNGTGVNAYFLGGSRNRMTLSGLQHSNTSMLLTDNVTTRTVIWNDTWQGNERDFAYDALYDANQNVIYQSSFNSEKHGNVIAMLDPTNGNILGWYDSKLSNIEEYLGTQLLENAAGDSLVLTGYAHWDGFQPTADRIDKLTFTNQTAGRFNVNMFDTHLDNVWHNQNIYGFDSHSDAYAFPKSTTLSPNGGYMIVVGGRDNDFPDHTNKLTFIKINTDLMTACQANEETEALDGYTLRTTLPVITHTANNSGVNLANGTNTLATEFPCATYCDGGLINTTEVICGSNPVVSLNIDSAYPIQNTNMVWSPANLVTPTSDPRIFETVALTEPQVITLQGFSTQGGCLIYEQTFNISFPAGNDYNFTDCTGLPSINLCYMLSIMDAGSTDGIWYVGTVSASTELNSTNYPAPASWPPTTYPYVSGQNTGCNASPSIGIDATPTTLVYQVIDPVTGCIDESILTIDTDANSIDPNFDPATSTSPYLYWDFRSQLPDDDFGQYIFTCSPNDIDFIPVDQRSSIGHNWKFDEQNSNLQTFSTSVNPQFSINNIVYGAISPNANAEAIDVEHTLTSLCGEDTTVAALIIVPEIDPSIVIDPLSDCSHNLTVTDNVFAIRDLILSNPNFSSLTGIPSIDAFASIIWNDANGIVIGSGQTYQATADGTYTATITYFGGSCTASVSATVTGTNTFTLNDISIDGCDIGNGTGIFDLAATQGAISSLSGLTFTWWEDAIQTIQINTSTPYIGPAGTVYAVASSPDGCQSMATVSLNLKDAPILIVNGETELCAGDLLELQATADGGVPPYSIDWVYNNGNNTHTGNVLQVTSSVGVSSYQVTVTDANGCSTTQTIDVRATSCCPIQKDEDYFQITDYQSGNHLVTNGDYIIWPDKVYIGPGLTVVVSGKESVLDITNCDVVFGECAKIEVRNGARIIANNAVLRPCDEMQTWQGVEFIFEEKSAPTGSFTESTFINATTGIGIRRANQIDTGIPVEVEITNNLFLNNKTGVQIANDYFEGAITGNTFKIEKQVAELHYCGEKEPNSSPSVNFGGIKLISNEYLNYSVINHNVIAQNDFVKGINLISEESKLIQFDGIHMIGTVGTSISFNQFTNNDRSVIMLRVIDVTVENNSMEVTRRSNADLGTYQISFDGVGNYDFNALIQNNEILNSAELLYESNATNSNGNFVGTGAIYASKGGKVQIESNKIIGYEIGIFIDNHKSAGILSRIVNNDIQTHTYGIYQRDTRWTTEIYTSFIGCNTIDMLLNVPGNTLSSGVVGYYLDYTSTTVTSTNPASNSKIISNVFLFGNCIKNTTSAVKLVHTNPAPSSSSTLPLMIRMENNYLYNYRYAGLDITDFHGTVQQNNSFISNQPQAVADIHSNRVIPLVIPNNQLPIVSKLSHFGIDNAPTAGGNGTVYATHIDYPSVTSCGNQDAGSSLKKNFIDYCENENWADKPKAAIAEQHGNTVSLNDDYQEILLRQAEESLDQVVSTTFEMVNTLTDESDQSRLVDFVNQHNWLSHQDNQWLTYYRLANQSNYEQAQVQLASMIAIDEQDRQHLFIESLLIGKLLDSEADHFGISEMVTLQNIGNTDTKWSTLANALLHSQGDDNHYSYPSTARTTAYSDTEVYNLDMNALSVYPNPANDQINVLVTMTESLDTGIFKIYDISGSEVHSVTVDLLSNVSVTVDISQLPAGIYLIKLDNHSDKHLTQKFIKK